MRRALDHPVRHELRRLLFVILTSVVVMGALTIGLDLMVGEVLRERERECTDALSESRELNTVLARMTAPPGVAPGFIDRLDNEAAFVGSVTRDVGLAIAMFERLREFGHIDHGASSGGAARIERALAELRDLRERHSGDPLALAREAATRPLYAKVVAEQLVRSHDAMARQGRDIRERVEWASTLLLVLALLVTVYMSTRSLRRSVGSIDGILASDRDSRERLQAVLGAVPDLWFLIDERRRFAGVSDAANRLLPRPWSELEGRPWSLVPAPATPREVDALLTLAETEGGVASIEYDCPLAPDAEAGAIQAFEARIVRMPGGRWLYLSRDISERRQAELAIARTSLELEGLVEDRTRELRAARDAAERANHAKSEFLSRMSHELRTPMNAVLGFSELLELDPTLDAQGRDYVAHILRAGEHLLALINEVLDLAHVESGRLTLSPEPMPLERLVADTVKVMAPLAAQRDVRLEVVPMSDVVVRGDRLRVRQVLLNLLSNAIKYNRPGGWVRVDAATVDASRVRITIADSGVGIQPGGLSRLFQPFDRLGAERGEVEGTGIGLSITKRLVELMGGTVGATSEVGIGTSIWFELPADRMPAGATPHPDNVIVLPLRAAHRARVLYVEDNVANVELVRHILARHPGIELITAPTGALGIDVARMQRPDLLLLDLHLPDLNGYTVLERLREERVTSEIPAIALTANAMPGERERALGAGFVEFLTKPIDLPGFEAALMRRLPRSRVPDVA